MLTNELEYAKLLRQSGFSTRKSEAIMSMITSAEIHNLYSKNEIDMMLSEAIEKVFTKQDDKLNEQRREFDARMVLIKEQINKDHDELKASRRWIIGTIVTVGMGLAAYLSALIKLSH